MDFIVQSTLNSKVAEFEKLLPDPEDKSFQADSDRAKAIKNFLIDQDIHPYFDSITVEELQEFFIRFHEILAFPMATWSFWQI